MANAENLREALTAYDGRSSAILSEISERYGGEKRFLSELIALAFDFEPAISEGATWILKAELEKGHVLSSQNVEQLTSRLSDVTAWQAQLHICQSIQYLVVPQELELQIELWLKSLLGAPRPFLRAWSVDALCRLRGGSSPKTKILLDEMETDVAASVRARVCNLKREFGAG